jgi:hypothetical protein
MIAFVLVSKPTLKQIKFKPLSFDTKTIISKETQHSNNDDINLIM